MRKIRIGKDILVTWEITVEDGSTLEKDELYIELVDPVGNKKKIDTFELESNTITFGLRGTAFKLLGVYILTLWKNKNDVGQTAVDVVDAFKLVKYTNEEGEEDCDE